MSYQGTWEGRSKGVLKNPMGGASNGKFRRISSNCAAVPPRDPTKSIAFPVHTVPRARRFPFDFARSRGGVGGGYP
eukprot:2399704-Rhodomonas_salina.1